MAPWGGTSPAIHADAMRTRPSSPRLCRLLVALACTASSACSGAGGGPVGLDPVSVESGASISFQGQVRDQHTGTALSGIRVSGGGQIAWSDAGGRFTMVLPEGAQLTFTGAGYYDRVAAVDGASGSFSIVPRSFDMGAFNDMARDYSSGTVRWLSSPHVYVDVRAHDFAAGTSVPAEWVDQVVAEAPRFLSRWTGGAVSARSVTVGTTPPSPGTPGTLVIAFDENPSRYPSAASAGVTVASWDPEGAIRNATIRLRFSGLTGAAASFSRQAVLGHELGHAVGLAHMDGSTSSMMNSVVRTPEPTAFDVAAGSLLYDRRPGTRADDREVAGGTRTAMTSGAVASAVCDVEIEAGS